MKRREDRVTEGLPALVGAEPTNDSRNLPKQIRSMKMLGAQLASHVPVLDLEFLMGEYTLMPKLNNRHMTPRDSTLGNLAQASRSSYLLALTTKLLYVAKSPRLGRN